MGTLVGHLHGSFHRVRIQQWHIDTLHDLTDQGRIAPDQHHSPGVAGNGRRQRQEVLPLALAAQNQHDLTVRAQPLQGRYGGAYIGPLAVVKKFHAVDNGNRFHPVRLTPVFAQAKQQGAQGATC